MRLALAQMKMSESMEKNFKKTLRLIRDSSSMNADMICFPEIQLTPFFPQYPDKNAEDFVLHPDSAYVNGICAACKEFGIFATPNLYVEENGKRYDMSLLIDDKGQIIGRQKMVHIAQCEHFYEQSYYTPSEEGFSVFDTKHGKIGIVVCFDRHYPESIRTEALNGAELIIIPTANTITEPSQMFQWEVKVQAFQNSVNIAMCNRTGIEGDMVFSGESIVSDHSGETIKLAGADEQLLLADIDMSGASAMRAQKPYTSLRRPEFYT